MTPIISCTGNETWVIITSSIVYFEVFVRPIILYKNVEQKFQISFEYKMQYKIGKNQTAHDLDLRLSKYIKYL